MRIRLIPIGDIEKTIIASLQKGLSDKFHAEVSLGYALPEPDYAFDQKRRQHRANSVVLALTRHGSYRESERVIGVVEDDLFVPELDFVFGVARDRIALISLTRLRPGFYGLPENESLFIKRALIEATHELGHTFGLEHCRNPRCVMAFSSSITEVDRKGCHFCPVCLRRIFPET